MTNGQERAVEQLQEIEAASYGSLHIVSVEGGAVEGDWCHVTVSMATSGLPRIPGGLPLRGRERLIISVPPKFPFAKPEVSTVHTRWATFPHVQWKRHLCLYQAPAVEWRAADGMYGFIQRLDEWIRSGAMGELDPIGLPLHPPVAYTASQHVAVARANTPVVTTSTWFGFAQLEKVRETRVDITAWLELASDIESTTTVAATILLAEPMPFEFPETMSDLITELDSHGVSRSMLLSILRLAVLYNDENDPLFVVIGTPMRGIQGQERKQHLAVWYLEPVWAKALRLSLNVHSEHEALRDIGKEVEDMIWDWATSAKVAWCSVLEDREEVTVRRDSESPAEWFNGKAVAIWGCGAIGSHVAECVTRAGAKRVVLRDNKRVAPGVLVRQQFDDTDVGKPKVHALAERLKRIRPLLDVSTFHGNIVSGLLAGDTWTDEADVVIDCTASEVVLAALELRRRLATCENRPIISMAFGHKANRGIVVIAGQTYTGGPADVLRKVKVDLCNRDGDQATLDEFWPTTPRTGIFQAEPGCSDPTFTGSSADVAALSAVMLNCAAISMVDTPSECASCYIVAPPMGKTSRLQFLPDVVSFDRSSGFETRISPSAWAEMSGWINRSRRLAGPNVETGGLLFGHRDDACNIIWVSEAIGPPPDSTSSEELFECGVIGTSEANREKSERSRQSTYYVGMWHTHPASLPTPSHRDFEAMRRLLTTIRPAPSRSILAIIGPGMPTPIIGTFVFHRSDFDNDGNSNAVRQCLISRVDPPQRPGRIGLALSGGGARAMAFHLGCLRALHDRGVLDRIDVISAVSGGSVIAGMYAYSSDTFEEFDARVVRILRKGLLGDIIRRTFFSPLLFGIIATTIVSGLAAVAADIARSLGAKFKVFRNVRPPFLRWITRTSAFEATLHDVLFGDAKITDSRRHNVDIVINACELRTGTAFRFGNRASMCWRFGRIANNNVLLSKAIAASAAYPVLLPAIDQVFQFESSDGTVASKRVLLTDGGVYDNLGITCLEPGRSVSYGYPPFELDYIVACDAGGGQFGDETIPYSSPARMIRAFESIFRRVQSSSHARLHNCIPSGNLKGFVLAYLGQQDGSLGYRPPDLVKRDEVKNYPTDFSPMSQESLDRIALRGEQLTRLLIDRYCPEL